MVGWPTKIWSFFQPKNLYIDDRNLDELKGSTLEEDFEDVEEVENDNSNPLKHYQYKF